MEVINTVGRRKAAVARVYVKPGKGTITINKKPLETYFPLDIFQFVVKQPLLVINATESYDITINLDGGGIKGQAEAARLGIARALCEIDAELRPILKKNGFLTRDPREVERKKPGQPGARRKFQFSKRSYSLLRLPVLHSSGGARNNIYSEGSRKGTPDIRESGRRPKETFSHPKTCRTALRRALPVRCPTAEKSDGPPYNGATFSD